MEHLCDAEIKQYLSRLHNIYMCQHMTTATHLRQFERIHDLAFRRLVDIFRGEVDNLVDVEIAGKLDFTHFG